MHATVWVPLYKVVDPDRRFAWDAFLAGGIPGMAKNAKKEEDGSSSVAAALLSDAESSSFGSDSKVSTTRGGSEHVRRLKLSF